MGLNVGKIKHLNYVKFVVLFHEVLSSGRISLTYVMELVVQSDGAGYLSRASLQYGRCRGPVCFVLFLIRTVPVIILTTN